MAENHNWQSRIIGEGEEAPDQLLANPLNWRIHPKAQQDALEQVLDKVGWVQRVLVNQRTGRERRRQSPRLHHRGQGGLRRCGQMCYVGCQRRRYGSSPQIEILEHEVRLSLSSLRVAGAATLVS